MSTAYTPIENDFELPYRLNPPIDGVRYSLDPKKSKTINHNRFDKVMSYMTNKNFNFALLGLVVLIFLTKDHVAAELGSFSFMVVFIQLVITFFLVNITFKRTIAGLIGVIFVALFILPIFINPYSKFMIMITLFASVVNFYFRNRDGKPSRVDYSNLELANLKESMRATWGVAGGHIGSNSDFGSAAVAGAKGERRIGKELARLTDEFPFVRVFHGIRFTPGKDGADIDHAVLMNDKVYLIDAKNWLFGEYYWVDGQVHRNGGSFLGGDVRMNVAMEKWSKYLGHQYRYITSRIAMTKEENNNNKYFYTNNNSQPNVSLTTVNDLITELRRAASETEPVVDRRLLRLFANQRQSF